MKKILPLFFVLIAFAIAEQVKAQPVSFVKDVNTNTETIIGGGWGLTNVNGTVFFFNRTITTGDELWKSDGTEAGTVLVKDISNYDASSGSPYYVSRYSDHLPSSPDVWPQNYNNVINGVLYFSKDDGIHGREFWKSDGTEAGTVMVKDIFPGGNGSSPGNFTNVNGVLYFSANDGSYGNELWKSDGTEAGTVMVKEINTLGPPGPNNNSSFPRQLIVSNGILYFTANDGVTGEELWKSDGTEAGTVLIKDIFLGSPTTYNSSYPDKLIDVNGVLFFIAKDNTHGHELWKTDGTEAGTVMVKDINTGAPGTSDAFNDSYPEHIFFAVVNGVLYFNANDYVHGNELWKSDGTEAGTVMVKDIDPFILGGSPYSSTPEYLTNVNGVLYFAADVGSYGVELWRSDGTEAGTVLVKDILPGVNSSVPVFLTNVNGVLYFIGKTNIINNLSAYELWKSDGTEAGTVLVKDIWPGVTGSFPHSLTNVNGVLYFEADDSTHSQELWKSDGTEAGTVMVKDISGTVGGGNVYMGVLTDIGYQYYLGPRYLTDVNGVLYFRASSAMKGDELWKSDGTVTGTTLVKDIYAGTSYSSSLNGSNPLNFINVNGVLYFTADDQISGQELWKSDGTEAGTVLVKDIDPYDFGNGPQYLTNMNGILFFIANDQINGLELWKSDGTEAGTVMVKDITGDYSYSNPQYLTNVSGVLYFTANDHIAGPELWKSDGTEAGTVLVKDIRPGYSYIDAGPENLTNVNGLLYFVTNDGTTGKELWKSDGTAAGTVLVKDVYPGTTGSNPSDLTNVNGLLYFLADNGSTGKELWKSDGTEAGTVLVKDIYPGITGNKLSGLASANGKLYFSADDGTNGREFWRSDGTEAGTVMVKDIWPGASSGLTADTILSVQNQLLFRANDGIHGWELWKSDGTAAGTNMVQDVATPGSSNPDLFTIVSTPNPLVSSVFMSAATNEYGRELWVTQVTSSTALPLTMLSFDGRLINNNAVLNWKTTGEQNTLSFDIERSINGSIFTTVGNVAAFNSTGDHQYDFTDNNITSLGIPVIYYRLKQKDTDDKFTYSKIIRVVVSGHTNNIRIYPNPASTHLHIDGKGIGEISIYDVSGRAVIKRIMNNADYASIDISKLDQGVYLVKVKNTDGNVSAEKLIVY